MAALDWSNCPAVESVPDRVGGAWVFRGLDYRCHDACQPLRNCAGGTW